jgi:Uma2 family endonuclease
MSTARRLHWSYDDYLSALESSELKLEYLDGEIFAMAGGTPTHAELSASVVQLLANALRGTCRVHTSDLKVRIEATGLSTYPDASVVCGERVTSSIDRHAMTNPTLLVEVTSRSTEDYDRGEKLSHYKQLPSLRAVLIVSHRYPRVTVITRSATGWEEREARPSERVPLSEPRLELSVDELYRGIPLEAE